MSKVTVTLQAFKKGTKGPVHNVMLATFGNMAAANQFHHMATTFAHSTQYNQVQAELARLQKLPESVGCKFTVVVKAD